MAGEAEKLEIVDQRAALEPEGARNHRLHLTEEQFLRDAAEIAKRVTLRCGRVVPAYGWSSGDGGLPPRRISTTVNNP